MSYPCGADPRAWGTTIVTQHLPRPARIPILAVLCGLLIAGGILAAPPAPAGPQPSPSATEAAAAGRSRAAMPQVGVPDAAVPDAAVAGTAPGTGGGARPDAGPRAPASGQAARPTRPDDLPISLVYSGLLGLAISITGLTMIMIRRRVW